MYIGRPKLKYTFSKVSEAGGALNGRLMNGGASVCLKGQLLQVQHVVAM